MRKLFSIDCHCATTTDLQWMAKQWGDLQIDEWNIGHHAHFMGKTRFCPPIFENEEWRNLSPSMVDAFYEQHKNSFDEYDGFVVNYPFPFCLLWEKFKKPIYANICIRYEYPFSWDWPRLAWLIDHVFEMRKTGQLKLNANNQFDAQYLTSHHSDLRVDSIIPNICAYHEIKHFPKKSNFWVHSKVNFKGREKMGAPFPKNHTFSEIAEGSGVFFVPYNVSVMSFYEWYAAGIPIYVPSKAWMMGLEMPETYFNKALSKFTKADELSLSDFYENKFPFVTEVQSAKEFIQNATLAQCRQQASLMASSEQERRSSLLSQWRNFLFS